MAQNSSGIHRCPLLCSRHVDRGPQVKAQDSYLPLTLVQRLGHKGGDERGLAFQEIARAMCRMLVLAMHTAPQAYPAPANRHSTALKRWRTDVALGKSSRGRPREERGGKSMSHDAVEPRGP